MGIYTILKIFLHAGKIFSNIMGIFLHAGCKEFPYSNPDALKIEEMEDTFDLVMVAERWDESMVLLRDLLCWEFRSVA